MLYRRCSVVWMEMIGRPDGMAYGMWRGCDGIGMDRSSDAMDGLRLVDLDMSRVSRSTKPRARSVGLQVMGHGSWSKNHGEP